MIKGTQGKLLFFILLLITIILGSTVFFWHQQLRGILVDGVKRDAQNLSAPLLTQFTTDLNKGFPDLQSNRGLFQFIAGKMIRYQLANLIQERKHIKGGGVFNHRKEVIRMTDQKYFEKGRAYVFSNREVNIGSEDIFISIPYDYKGNRMGYLLLIYSSGDFVTAQKKLTQNIMLLFLIFFIVGVGIAYLIARNISKPILKLKRIARRIAGGDFQIDIDISGSSEMISLANSLKEMKSALLTTISGLKKSEQDLWITINSISEGVIAIDSSGYITRMNRVAERFLQRDYQKEIRMMITDLFPLQSDKNIDISMHPGMLTLKHGEAITSKEYLFSPRKGKDRFISMSSSPIVNEENALIGAVIVFRDITEQHKMELQLRQTQKMDAVGQLAGGIAHDFNNMLGGILGGADYLKEEITDPEHEEVVDMILYAAERSSELIGNLLSFARKGQFEFNVFDLHEGIYSTISLLKHSLDKRVKISLKLNAVESYVEGDLTRLQNALLNLGINAAYAMPEGGQLTYRTENREQDGVAFLSIFIEDTGVGIPEHHLTHIFEPFFTTRKQGEGTGLGLSAVYGIVKQHQGEILVQSELGKGSCFEIRLPVSSGGDRGRNRDRKPVSGTGLILIVDDEMVLRKTTVHMLQKLGYETIFAASGEEALELFHQRRGEIDLILLDMMMPGMGGRACYQELIKIDPEISVVIISGFMTDEDIREMKVQKVKGMIRKPFNLLTLSEAVSAGIHSK